MGKKLVKSESDIRKGMMLPNQHDLLGSVTKNLGYTRMIVKCQDGHTRSCRIRGKMKRRAWVRLGDIVIVHLGTSSLSREAMLSGVTEETKSNGYEQKDT